MEKDVLKQMRKFMKEVRLKLDEIVPMNKKGNFTEAQVIQHLIKHEGEDVYLKDLVESLNMRKSSITERLDIMEEKGIIVRIPDGDDKRKKKVCLTESSLEKKKEIEEGFVSLTEKMLEDIPEEKLNIFYEVLETMERNIKK